MILMEKLRFKYEPRKILSLILFMYWLTLELVHVVIYKND